MNWEMTRIGIRQPMRERNSGGSGTFSLGGQWGPWFWVRGHSIRTTTGFLLRTILCKSLVLMPRVKFVENTQNMHTKKSIVLEF